MKYLLILIWLELIIVFATGCSSPREKRGDGKQNLSGRTYEPIDFDWWRRRSPWYRDYKTTEEIQEDWHRVYNELREEENEDIH